MVVVFPHPDGPTKATSSPAGMSNVTLSTAGADWPGNCLVSARNSMPTPAASLLNTEPPRGGQVTDGEEEEVEEHGDDHDAEGACQGGVERVHRAQAGQAFEDLRTEPGAVDVGGDCRDTNDHLGGHPYSGENERPGQRQLQSEQHPCLAH